MDCEMPIMDGYQASIKIREDGKDVMIVGVTGHSGDQYQRRCKLAGMDDVIPKPIDFELLKKVVNKALSR